MFTPLKLTIDQIFYIIKHQLWMKLPMTAKHDPDSLKAGSCSFHDNRGHATMHCWALKRYLKDLVQRGYLDEFIFSLEEDPEGGKAPIETVN